MARFLRALPWLVAFIMVASLAACVSQPPAPETQPSGAPVRLAFYYGWFGGAHGAGWNQQGLDPFTKYHPTDGYYNSSDLSLVQKQVGEMQYAGLQGGIASWWGQGSLTDQNVAVDLQAARGTTFRWTLYYEPEGSGNPSVSQIQSDLNYIKTKYANNPAFLHLDGKPVLFVYNADDTSCTVADRWAQADPNHDFNVVLKVFSGYTTCAHQPYGWHQYGPASATDQQGKYSFAVSPGFNKANETSPRLTRDPARFAQNVQAMAASGARFQLVTTFNEWGEGTSIEPATEWASASGYGTYLDILHQYLVGGSSPPTTSPPTTTPPTTTPPTTTPPTTTPPPPPPGSMCGTTAKTNVNTVVVISFENKTWSSVGGVGFGTSQAPYLHSLTNGCTYFSNWTEINPNDNSAQQYVGYWTGFDASVTHVSSDCSPSASCSYTGNNLFRVLRNAGVGHREYVEGATTGCSASGNAAKHIPDLYMWDPTDRANCANEVRPLSELNWSNPPVGYTFVTPTLCNDAHDCSFTTFDNWLKNGRLSAILASPQYQAGHVLVEIWGDEDHPVPNLFLCAGGCAHSTAQSVTGVGHGSAAKLAQEVLVGSVPLNVGQIASEPSIRAVLGI